MGALSIVGQAADVVRCGVHVLCQKNHQSGIVTQPFYTYLSSVPVLVDGDQGGEKKCVPLSDVLPGLEVRILPFCLMTAGHGVSTQFHDTFLPCCFGVFFLGNLDLQEPAGNAFLGHMGAHTRALLRHCAAELCPLVKGNVVDSSPFCLRNLEMVGPAEVLRAQVLSRCSKSLCTILSSGWSTVHQLLEEGMPFPTWCIWPPLRVYSLDNPSSGAFLSSGRGAALPLAMHS